MLARIERSA